MAAAAPPPEKVKKTARFSADPSEMRLFDPRNQFQITSPSLGVPIKGNNGGRSQSKWRRPANSPLYLKTSGLYTNKAAAANVNIAPKNALVSAKITAAMDKIYPGILNELIQDFTTRSGKLPSFAEKQELQAHAWQNAYGRVRQTRKNLRIDPVLFRNNNDNEREELENRNYFFTEEEIPQLRALQEPVYATPENARRLGEATEAEVAGNAVNLGTLKMPPAAAPNLVNWKARGLNLEENFPGFNYNGEAGENFSEEAAAAEFGGNNDENEVNIGNMTPAQMNAYLKSLKGGRARRKGKKRVQTLKKKLRRGGRGTRRRRA